MTTEEQPQYVMNMNVLFDHLAKVDVPQLVADCKDPWWNQTLVEVNGCVVRLGIIEGQFHWHKHDTEDEMFFVLQGRLIVEAEGADTVELQPHQGYVVPRGVLHRTRAPEKTVMLMMSRAGVVPTGS